MGTGATGAQRQSETGPHSALVGGSRITCHNRHMLSANAGDAVKTRTAQTAWQEDTVEGPPAGVTAARMTATRGCERFCRAQPVRAQRESASPISVTAEDRPWETRFPAANCPSCAGGDGSAPPGGRTDPWLCAHTMSVLAGPGAVPARPAPPPPPPPPPGSASVTLSLSASDGVTDGSLLFNCSSAHGAWRGRGRSVTTGAFR